MAINFLNSIDLNQLELLNAAIENQATDALAGTGVDGQLYYNTTDDDLKVWTGSAWSTIVTTGSGDAVESITAGNGIFVTGTPSVPIVSVAYLESANGALDNIIQKAPTNGTLSSTNEILVNKALTGTFNAAKVALNTIPINFFATAIGDIDLGGFKASNLADPTGTQDAATKAYVDAATVGGLIYQGGYNASTNSPALDTAVAISGIGSGSGPFTGTVATTGGSGTGMTVYVETNPFGGLITARVVNGGSGYAAGDSVTPVISGHTGQLLSVSSVPIANIAVGWTYTVTTGGYFYNELVGPGDVIIAEVNAPTEQDAWTKVQNNIDLATETQVGIGNVFAGTSATITAPYLNGTATLDVVDSSGSQKGAVIVAGGDGIGVAYSSGTATVSLDKISFTNTGPATDSTSYTIPGTTHFLGNNSSIIMVQLVEVATGETVYADVTRGTSGLITITFAETQTANSYRALLQKIV
jgi:hypothetical protein